MYVVIAIFSLIAALAVFTIGFMIGQSGAINDNLDDEADCKAFADNTLDKIKSLSPELKHQLDPEKPPRPSFFGDVKHYDCVQCCIDANDIQRVMILCPTCGNKRCLKARNHRNECTHSNDVNQSYSHNKNENIHNMRIDGTKITNNK